MGHPKWVFDLFARLWPLLGTVNWLSRRPLIEQLLRPLYGRKSNEIVLLPVQETIPPAESVVLPYALLTPLIQQASARCIMNECLCRRGQGCQAYPHDFGCLFLGDGAARIHPDLGRLVSVDEALAHVDQAAELGLTPLIAHQVFDAYLLGIPYRRMLAICFCCECCCGIYQSIRQGPHNFWDAVVPMPGVSVTVGPECIHCGRCLPVCQVQAIVLNNGRAQIGPQCKGCGRCAAVCPTGAIHLRIEGETEVQEHLLARIERRTDIG